MNRKDFLEKSCGLSACSCLGLGLFSTQNMAAAEDNQNDWKDEFIKHRFAKLIEILDSTLDEDIKNQVIENLGKISKSICQCSVGWQTQTYNTILGRKVKARCLESVVRGSTKCVFEI